MRGKGFLAIWSDVTADKETDYLHWLTREHASERIGIDGFLAVRVFRALRNDCCRYLILYELEGPDAVGSPAYLARLNAPTPWSQRIMPILGNFIRGGGTRVDAAGVGQGGFVVPVRLSGSLPANAPTLVAELAKLDRIAAVRLLQTDQARTLIKTKEKSIRAEDRSFDALLLMEGLDEASVQSAVGRLASLPFIYADLSRDSAILYSNFFILSRSMLRSDS